MACMIEWISQGNIRCSQDDIYDSFMTGKTLYRYKRVAATTTGAYQENQTATSENAHWIWKHMIGFRLAYRTSLYILMNATNTLFWTILDLIHVLSVSVHASIVSKNKNTKGVRMTLACCEYVTGNHCKSAERVTASRAFSQLCFVNHHAHAAISADSSNATQTSTDKSSRYWQPPSHRDDLIIFSP